MSRPKGSKLTEEHKNKIALALKGNKNCLGKISFWRGKKFSFEYRKKLSAGHQKIDLKDWKGFSTSELKRLRCSKEWKDWRKKVFERDNYICQKCHAKNEKGLGKTLELNPHHIKSVNDYPENVLDVDNGITLCRDCHQFTESWGRQKNVLVSNNASIQI